MARSFEARLVRAAGAGAAGGGGAIVVHGLVGHPPDSASLRAQGGAGRLLPLRLGPSGARDLSHLQRSRRRCSALDDLRTGPIAATGLDCPRCGRPISLERELKDRHRRS